MYFNGFHLLVLIVIIFSLLYDYKKHYKSNAEKITKREFDIFKYKIIIVRIVK